MTNEHIKVWKWLECEIKLYTIVIFKKCKNIMAVKYYADLKLGLLV